MAGGPGALPSSDVVPFALRDMARLAYETVREMMAAGIDEPDARPGMVGVIQTFASSLKWNPLIHAIASRGVWTPDGQALPGA